MTGGARALAGGVCLLEYCVGSDFDLLRVSIRSDLDVEAGERHFRRLMSEQGCAALRFPVRR